MAAHLRRPSNISISTSSSSSYMPASASAASTPVSSTSPTFTAPTPANTVTSATSSPSSAVPHLAIRPAIETPGYNQAGPPLNKMAMAAVISPATDQSPPPRLPVSVTSKEWVVPPRPKPGRKPATDTPPTKRKAQNRAAQRAFRERRAARIGELEDLLEDQRGDHEREEHILLDRIEALQNEAHTLQGRCQMLESLLESERRAREQLNVELEGYRRKRKSSTHHLNPSSTNHSHLASTTAQQQSAPMVPGFPAYHSASSTSARQDVRQDVITSPEQDTGLRPVVHALPISHIISPPDEDGRANLSCGACGPDGACACADAAMASAVMGCGKCALGSRCSCLDAEINPSGVGPGTDLKRPLRSPMLSSAGPDEKRQRSDALETDFTSAFARRKRSTSDIDSMQTIPPVPQQPPLLPPQLQTVPDKDSCGFCEEGTYCVCADAVVTLAPTATTSMAILPAPSLSQQNQMTPPPSETDVGPMAVEVMLNGAVKLPFAHGAARQAGSSGTSTRAARTTTCAAPAGPGTCAQCLADPKSGLFCRSLAANFAKTSRSTAGNATSPGGCCGNAGPGGCCKNIGGSSSGGSSGGGCSAKTNVTLSCADTYKTLASHRHFDEATDDIGTWLPLLKAAPGERPGAAGTGLDDHTATERLPIEVEAASIMGVLKTFDVRFGQ